MLSSSNSNLSSIKSKIIMKPFDPNKLDYGPQFLEAYSYEASHIDKSIPRNEKDPGSFTLPCYINNVCFDNALTNLEASISVKPLSTYLNLGLRELAHTELTVELAYRTVKYPKGIAENVLVGIDKFVFPVNFIILDLPNDVKVPLILERPFLSTAHAKIDVFKRKITLRVGDEKIIFKSVKPASSLIKRVYMLSLRERIELDLEARLMGETLVLNRSLDPLYGDYIELNDLNVPLELRRDQVDDLMPTIEEGEVIDEPMIVIIKTRNNESFDEEFYNSVIRDKVEIKGKNVVGAFMNVPILVGNFAIITHFIVVENMDGYRDQDMGDIILGEPFCKASCVEAKRFDGLITIHNGSDNMTYQMARSHPRFKHLSNAQCNKIKPLLKLKRRNMKKTDSDIQYAVSIKEDTVYLCLHFTKDHEGNKISTPYPENPIRRIQAMEIKDSGRYQTWWYQSHGALDLGSYKVAGLRLGISNSHVFAKDIVLTLEYCPLELNTASLHYYCWVTAVYTSSYIRDWTEKAVGLGWENGYRMTTHGLDLDRTMMLRLRGC
ncbi:retrovirus-related pol polyprotein from transposon TNT 1-94 [Tanacetum coccineum]|uniref:Retrovirus-related pol polyprotein from transposon TNT 1-94 n=1 Tax=Tanacetum coccineum TaxID=301880 RepID=A0ABQ5GLB4_9ASTR